MTMTRLFQVLAWVLLATIVVLSLVSPSHRPVSGASQGVEHAGIFIFAGLAFGLGYPRRPFVLMLVLVGYAGAVELAQLFAPGRHARLSDFVVDALAVCAGIAIAAALRLVARRA